MLTLGMPYRVVGGLRFYERQEIRDAVAYMRVLQSPADDLGFERIINLPRRGVGDVALRAMHAVARAQHIPLYAAADAVTRDGTLKGRRASGARAAGRLRALARDAGPRGPRADGGRAAGRERLRGDVAAGQVAGSAGPAGEPQGADAGAERVRDAVRLPRPCQPGDGERAGRRHRPAVDDDAARRQGAGVRHRVPAGLGGGAVPVAALDGRERQQGARGGAAARLCRHHAGAAAGDHQPRGEPAAVRQLAERRSRRASSTSCRRSTWPAPARRRWRGSSG